jgi:hypothetical protein
MITYEETLAKPTFLRSVHRNKGNELAQGAPVVKSSNNIVYKSLSLSKAQHNPWYTQMYLWHLLEGIKKFSTTSRSKEDLLNWAPCFKSLY